MDARVEGLQGHDDDVGAVAVSAGQMRAVMGL